MSNPLDFDTFDDTSSMASLFRETTAGQLLRYITGNRVLQYPEEKPGFQIPQEWLDVLNAEKPHEQMPTTSGSSSSSTHEGVGLHGDEESAVTAANGDNTETNSEKPEHDETDEGRGGSNAGLSLAKTQSVPVVPKTTKDGLVLVDWYTSDDHFNPYNWSRKKKLLSSFVLCLYTFIVYASSSIYIPSLPGIIEEYGVSHVEASLGLALYVLGYGIGPLIFSPLSEVSQHFSSVWDSMLTQTRSPPWVGTPSTPRRWLPLSSSLCRRP